MHKLKDFLFKNIILISYIIFAIVIELLGSFLTDGKFYIKDPRYITTLIVVFSCIILLFKNKKTSIYVASGLLIVQGLINTVFIVLFELAGQWFDYSMFYLRNDAMGILEGIPINFWFFMFLLIGLSAFIIFGLRLSVYIDDSNSMEYNKRIKKNFIITTCLFVALGLNVLTASSIHGASVDIYEELLRSDDQSKYNQYGILSNFINEIYGGTIFNKAQSLGEEEILNFLYSQEQVTSEYFGVSKGNNVVTILGETFEWFSFVSDLEKYPNGLDLSKEQLDQLFPNLRRMYNESYVLNNYHAREKTDISENYSIVGSYPINSYINYNYYDNVLPQTMPNMLKNEYGENYSSQYFHDGYEDFYNRKYSVKGLGFDDYYTTEKMLEVEGSVMVNYGDIGERNLDSEMVETCKDLMFPTDRKFYTYITTITMHGMYKERENLRPHYDKLNQVAMLDITSLEQGVDDNLIILYTYIAAAMEVDKMLGKIFSDLEEKNLLENTTIIMFGDHQGYYQGISNYVKNIESPIQALENNINYMDLYRVPAMIYDQKLVKAVKDNNEPLISEKFSSSCDIVPTLLDILGIKHYANTYYGNSIFSDTTSLVYSRGYGYFLDEYSYFYNINNFSYINPVVSDEKAYIQSIETKGNILINKIKHIDQAFKTKIFNDPINYNDFYDRIDRLNNK